MICEFYHHLKEHKACTLASQYSPPLVHSDSFIAAIPNPYQVYSSYSPQNQKVSALSGY